MVASRRKSTAKLIAYCGAGKSALLRQPQFVSIHETASALLEKVFQLLSLEPAQTLPELPG